MKPLTKRQRSLSLWVLILIFIICVPFVLLYSLGYRFDDTFSLQKTGGIFIHSDIANTSTFIDGEFLKNSGIFIRNILVQELVPKKTYRVEVHKDGLQSWVKDLYVYPSIVTEGRVLMLPEEFDPREILPYIDADGIATSTPVSTSTRSTSPRPLKPADLKPNNPEYLLIQELFAPATTTATTTVATTLTTGGVRASSTSSTTVASTSEVEVKKSEIELFFEALEIEEYQKLENLIVTADEVSWIEDGDIQLYWTDSTVSALPYYYCGGLLRECDAQIILDWEDDIIRFVYMPGRNDVWIVATQKGIYAVEVDGRSQRNIQDIQEGENLDFRLDSNDRLIIENQSRFFEINL